MTSPHLWTEDDLAYVRQLATDGETALAISHALSIRVKRDITRNSIIGICRRRGIVIGSPSPHNTSGLGRKGIRKPYPKRDLKADAPVERKARKSKGFVFGKLLAAPMPEPEPADIPDAMPIGLVIMDLDRDACRYPLGDPRADDFRFCGDLKKPGSSYCAGHHALCYVARSEHPEKRTLFRELVG